MNRGSLYITATPIGNREDITLRAIDTLRSVDLIAAEDTRHSKKLLEHYGIKTPLLSLHEHNEAARATLLCEKLKQGLNVALISDAGTPLISDPGYRLVNAVREAGIEVVPIPGACAAIAALVASGLPTDRFIFEGFIPSKGEVRRKKLEDLKNQRRTIIFYESVHRIVNLIDLLNEIFGTERRATIARELTKKFETIHTATLAELKNWINENPVQEKGEFVVIVAGQTEKLKEINEEHQQLLTLLLSELSLKQAVSLATKISGLPRKKLYALALTIQQHLPHHRY
ncbi:16S rRNA (cytidine(1402)-2'-O)-methyltransferase [Coxiella burnetii]|uniref:Ribosomal RNA small subunit methyltransferase I n=1 Tax=Coxiella burnetii (strain Dugway 5J108-111) TaxID=434922 RepID=A9KBZ0_COXBN|nr:16S rRNA (cytidine(1402)-2'-O)-methyltransferase [Coxiella burnetii]ABS78052.1 tetrapyrrole (corrin/porphyrin) methylase family protein [Coxiella burnetii Dugway 5J108-111]OYK80963.1 16S rRNA (cytidine(1402)-2'-O)-methyltransferase [Coxiella burnetii]OYK83051.1 16S rRNA (cytidine(1402)-2'-O)-methyltransferase [Coxiella burnetii]